MRRIFTGHGKLRYGVSYRSSNPPTIAYSKSYSFSPNRNHCSLASDSVFGATTVDDVKRRSNNEDSKGSFDSASRTTLSPETDSRGSWLVRLDNKLEDTSRVQPYDKFAGDVEKIYSILTKYHSQVAKLELVLVQSQVAVCSGLIIRVLDRCGDAGHLGYRFFAWASKQPGYSHNYDVFKLMIKILGKMRQFGVAWALINKMRQESPQHITPEVFIILIRRFVSARMFKKAVEVLDEMPNYGCEPDENMFGCLLDALCKQGQLKEAAFLFEDMRVRFPPTIKHFNSLLAGWCKIGKLREAKFILVQMKNAGFVPNIAVYNNLITGYARAGNMADAFYFLEEMRSKGCDPSVASFTILIQALCNQGKTEDALKVFFDMEKHDCEPDLITYTTLISRFCKQGNTKRGYELLDHMIQKGHTPKPSTYLHILISHEKKDEIEECLNLLDEMQKNGCYPNCNIYNPIIRLTFRLGEVKEGIRVWNQIEASGLSPGIDNYVNLIHGLIDQECLVEACEYFKEMVERGLFCTFQYGLMKVLLNSLLRADKIELSKDVWSCIVNKGCELNIFAWTIWIHALFAKGHLKVACAYCIDMMEADVMPQPDTFAKLMRGLKKLYNRVIAIEITEKVRKMAAERKITFKMYKKRGEYLLERKAKAKEYYRKLSLRDRKYLRKRRKRI